MKKAILLATSLLQVLVAAAQSAPATPKTETGHHVVAKTTTSAHDSVRLSNLTPSDTVAYRYSYGADSGFIAGINAAGHYGFAERYTFNSTDTTIQVIGVAAAFLGKVNFSSTKVVDLKIWDVGGTASSARPNLYYSGLPTTGLNSVMVPYTGLGICDTACLLKQYYFVAPTTLAGNTFFIGYTTNYRWDSLAGDTISVATTQMGSRTTPTYNVVGSDTIVNVQNATLIPVNVWVDNGYDLNYMMDYWIFPIVNIVSSEGTASIRRNDFTFYGVYPNPATSTARVKFALDAGTDVNLLIIDATGRTLQSQSLDHLSRGEYQRELDLSALPCGDYLCVIRTSTGDGVASKISVQK
jgi:hypothetical protein